MKHSMVMQWKTNINDSIHTHEGIKQATKEQNKRTNQHNKQARTHTLAYTLGWKDKAAKNSLTSPSALMHVGGSSQWWLPTSHMKQPLTSSERPTPLISAFLP